MSIYTTIRDGIVATLEAAGVTNEHGAEVGRVLGKAFAACYHLGLEDGGA